MSLQKRILVCTPPVETGGPELLHQLVYELRDIGHDAYICYYPFDSDHQTPKAYQHYNIPQSKFLDADGMIIVIPEVLTNLVRIITKAKIILWWLSVDNYYNRTGESMLLDSLRAAKSLFSFRKFGLNRVPLFGLGAVEHVCQSNYALEFLARNGLRGSMLGDYVVETYTCNPQLMRERKRVVCYNPKKGMKNTNKLIRACPEIKFIPISGLSAQGVRDLLSSAMIYIDFGHHPGKDRLPREAAIAGCCVITGCRGSAENDVDIPIEKKFKIDEGNRGWEEEFRKLTMEIFDNFDKMSPTFDYYRSYIRSEREVFQRQIKDIFGEG